MVDVYLKHSPFLYCTYHAGYSSTQLTIYKPLKDVTAYDGDANVKFSLVAASLGTTSISCYISSTPISSSLPVGTQLNTQSSVLAVIPGPVSVRDSGTGVVCYVNYDGLPIMVAQYTATLTVLGKGEGHVVRGRVMLLGGESCC